MHLNVEEVYVVCIFYRLKIPYNLRINYTLSNCRNEFAKVMQKWCDKLHIYFYLHVFFLYRIPFTLFMHL